MKNTFDFDFDTRRAIVIASAAAVASSSSEALASSRPVRSITICCQFQQRFQAALGYLGLVGRGRRTSRGSRAHVAQPTAGMWVP